MRLPLLALLLSGCGGPDTSITKQDPDADEDGFHASVDCDETHATVNPDAPERCDGLDNDCDGAVDEDATDAPTWYADTDADTYGDPALTQAACDAPAGTTDVPGDCDDADADAFPGNQEVCDGVDNDCDGAIDEEAADAPTWYGDADGDGYGDPGDPAVACEAPLGSVADGTDCDDARADVHPEAPETDCADPLDYNCDGATGYADADGDGAPACQDCDDADSDVTATSTWYRDTDGDGWSDGAGPTIDACHAPAGYAADLGDCDDLDSDVNPGATEVCDAASVDENCNGTADDADATTDPASWVAWYRDSDGDGVGDTSHAVSRCDQPAGYVSVGGDCDDAATAIHPGAAEVCDAVDDDCDGLVDDADADRTGGSAWYRDGDGDGYGGSTATTACAAPAGYVATSTDCDDVASAVNPGAVEVCDPADVDEDCDRVADDADPSATGVGTWYADDDRDGYGDDRDSARGCDAPAGTLATGGDCDDAAAGVHPGAAEVCDGFDDDCDGLIDGADGGVTGTFTWYRDADADGYGGSTTAAACSAPAGYVDNALDCDDANAAISPGDAEVCDGRDDDCDGLVDGADGSVTGTATWHRDADADGYGGASTTTACSAPSGYVADATDCNDADPAISPGDPEVCDGVDDDCDGRIDDADAPVSGGSLWYADRDGDDYGDAAVSSTACAQPAGSVADRTDCDDGDATISPGAPEICDDGIDQDCDGDPDGGCLLAGELTDADAVVRIRGSSTIRLGTDICSVGDTNADGHDDLLLVTSVASVSATNQGAAMLFRGPLSGNYSVSAATATLTGEDASAYLSQCARVGDMDGDGLDDLLVSGWESDPTGYPNREGGAWAVFPPVTGTFSLNSADVQVAGGAEYRQAGLAIEGVGDLNGDDLADFAVVSGGSGSTTTNTAAFYFGPATGNHVVTSGDITVTGLTTEPGFGDVTAAGDLDGDGVGDFVFGLPFDDTGAAAGGAMYIVLGAPVTGTAPGQADYAYYGTTVNQYVGLYTTAVGDLDGDGYTELTTLTTGNVSLFLYGPLPASGPISTMTDAMITQYTSDPTAGPRGVGDLDGDGDDEVMVSDPNNTWVTGSGRGVVGLFDAPLGTLAAQDAETYFVGDTDGDRVKLGSPAGDLTGDGLDDVALIASGDDAAGDGYGAAWIFSPR